MSVITHWLAWWDYPTGGPAVSPVIVWDQKSADEYDAANYRVEGPFVPEADDAGAVDALRAIVDAEPTADTDADGFSFMVQPDYKGMARDALALLRGQ